MKKLFLPIAMLACAATAFADNLPYMIVETTQGSKVFYEISKVETLRFDGEGLVDPVKQDGTVTRIYFSTEAEGVNASFDGIEQSVSVSAFPNPVCGTLIIKGVDDNAAFSIYDLQGRKAMSGEGSTIDVTELPSSTYILKVNGEALKFIKK